MSLTVRYLYADENFLASASRDQTVGLWDRKTGDFVRTLLGTHQTHTDTHTIITDH
jgi:WD40 repeat protein